MRPGTGSRVWADNFGSWHAAITQELPGDLPLARHKAHRLIKDELTQNGAEHRRDRGVLRVSLVESTELDGAVTHHFKEV